MARIQLKNIAKTWGASVGVKQMSLDIADGEFLVLLGPSGCGKTTTMRMVAGLEDPTAGEIWIGDRCVNALEPKDRDVAMVFQSYGLYPNMTVYENISFPLRIRGTPKDEIHPAVMKASAKVELDDFLQRRPKELSGGQRQRVAMGRAIVRNPKLFLMDEPLSNLDAKLRVQTRAEISKLQRRLGVTTMYVTHDQIEAMTMGDRVAVLRRGVLMQCASPAELYETPENLFVGQFIGSPSMNVVRGSVTAGDGDDITIAIGSQFISLTGEAAARLHGLREYVGRDIAIGVRSEALGGDGTASLDVSVDLVEMLGSELLVHCTIDAPAVRAIDSGVEVSDQPESTIVASLDPRHPVKVGDRVHLSVDTLRMHAFDLETGSAIGRH